MSGRENKISCIADQYRHLIGLILQNTSRQKHDGCFISGVIWETQMCLHWALQTAFGGIVTEGGKKKKVIQIFYYLTDVKLTQMSGGLMTKEFHSAASDSEENSRNIASRVTDLILYKIYTVYLTKYKILDKS